MRVKQTGSHQKVYCKRVRKPNFQQGKTPRIRAIQPGRDYDVDQSMSEASSQSLAPFLESEKSISEATANSLADYVASSQNMQKRMLVASQGMLNSQKRMLEASQSFTEATNSLADYLDSSVSGPDSREKGKDFVDKYKQFLINEKEDSLEDEELDRILRQEEEEEEEKDKGDTAMTSASANRALLKKRLDFVDKHKNESWASSQFLVKEKKKEGSKLEEDEEEDLWGFVSTDEERKSEGPKTTDMEEIEIMEDHPGSGRFLVEEEKQERKAPPGIERGAHI